MVNGEILFICKMSISTIDTVKLAVSEKINL